MLNNIPGSHELFICGDFIGSVGRNRTSKLIGMHGEDCLDDNEEKLTQLYEDYGLRIMNTFFSHKNIHKHTCYQNTHWLKSIVDYAIMRQTSHQRLLKYIEEQTVD